MPRGVLAQKRGTSSAGDKPLTPPVHQLRFGGPIRLLDVHVPRPPKDEPEKELPLKEELLPKEETKPFSLSWS